MESKHRFVRPQKKKLGCRQKPQMLVVENCRPDHHNDRPYQILLWPTFHLIQFTMGLKEGFSRSTFLTATAAMAGGTKLFNGAHLSGGDTRFCRESRNHAGFGG